MFEALRCIFVPYRPRAIEDRLLGLPAEEPALNDFGSKLTLARMSTHFAEGFAHHLHPPPRKSGESELPGSQPGSPNWPVLPIGRLLDALLRIGSRSLTVVTAADGASISPPMHN